jgi:hypothetical protein
VTRALAAALAVALAAAAAPPAAAQATDGGPIRMHRLPPPPPPPPPPPWRDRTVAMLRGLDKSSGRSESFEIPVGATAPFGRLEVTVQACKTPPEGETADAAAHLRVVDTRAGGAPAFVGWMLASSPALSALDHPRYDVWALGCRD